MVNPADELEDAVPVGSDRAHAEGFESCLFNYTQLGGQATRHMLVSPIESLNMPSNKNSGRILLNFVHQTELQELQQEFIMLEPHESYACRDHSQCR